MNIYDEIRARTDLAAWTDLEMGKKQRCPFGCGKDPSFKVTPDWFICHRCGAKGDLFTWVGRVILNTEDRWEAARYLAGQLGLELKAAKREANPASEQYRELAETYHAALTPEAREYLHRRGIADEMIAEKLIGWVPADESRVAPDTFPALRDAGLPRLLRGRVLIPFWRRGRIVYVTGRAIDDREPKYLNQRGPKCYAGTVRGPELIVCEGPMDQLLAEQAGYNAVALAGSGGTLALTPGVKSVLLAFDPDEAGEAYTRRYIADFVEQGADVAVLVMPEGKDLADVLAAGGRVSELERVAAFDWLAARLAEKPKDRERKAACYQVMKRMEPTEQDAALAVMKRTLGGVSIMSLRKELRMAAKEREETEYVSPEGVKYAMPSGYTMNSHGVLNISNPKSPRVTNAPVYVSRTGRDTNGPGEYVELTYRVGLKTERRVVCRSRIAVSQSLVKESEFGVPVTSANVLDVVRFLDDWIHCNQDVIGKFRVTRTLGWLPGCKGFVLTDKVIA